MRVFPLSDPNDLDKRPNTRESRIEWRSFINRVDLKGYKIDSLEGAEIAVFKLQFSNRPLSHLELLYSFSAEVNQWTDPFLYWEPTLNRYFVVKGSSPKNLAWETFNNRLVSFAVTLEEQPYVNYPSGFQPTVPTILWTSERANRFGTFTEEIGSGYKSPAIWVSSTPGDFVTFVYAGNGCKVWAPQRPTGGLMKITIDGAIVSTVNLYAASPTPSEVLYDGVTVHSANQIHVVKLENVSTDPTRRELLVDAVEFVYTNRIP